MAHLAIDEAAWSSAWRSHAVSEKAALALGLLAVAMVARDVRVDLAVVVVAFVAVTVGARVAPGLVLRVWALPAVFVVIGLVGVLVSIGPAPDDALWQALSTAGLANVQRCFSPDVALRQLQRLLP
mgnify:CR=1 FL=1